MTEPERPGAAARDAVDRMRRAAADVPDRVPNPVLPDGDATVADQNADGAMVEARRKQWNETVPWRFRDARPADFPPPLAAALLDWVTTSTGNLVLLGAVGTGKSHAATAACRSRFAAGQSLIWLPIGELLDQLDWRRPDSATTMERLCHVDLLVVDDMGTERSNEWTGERLYLVLNRRWLDGRPTIATTNLEPAALSAALGERTYSRLRDGATAITFTGEDRRHGA